MVPAEQSGDSVDSPKRAIGTDAGDLASVWLWSAAADLAHVHGPFLAASRSRRSRRRKRRASRLSSSKP